MSHSGVTSQGSSPKMSQGQPLGVEASALAASLGNSRRLRPHHAAWSHVVTSDPATTGTCASTPNGLHSMRG